jgi:hypothetical protein
MLPEDTKKLMDSVLNEYVLCGVIGIACDHCNVDRRTHRVWLETYPEYKEMFETMKERFVDGLEKVAIERAKEKSDSLMILMLKSHRPQTYNQGIDLKVSPNDNLKFIFSQDMLSPEEKKLLNLEDGSEDE